MAGFFERLANMIDEEVSKAGANGNTASVPAAALKKPVTWNEFLEQTGKDVDQQVISHARKEGLIYVGGKCKFTATKCEEDKDKETFVVNVDAALYFKDQFKTEKNFQLYPLHREVKFSDFAEDAETREQLEKIKTEVVELDVETPQITAQEE